MIVPLPATMRRASYLVAGVVVTILVTMMLLLRHQERAVVGARRALRRLPGSVGNTLGDVLENFLQGVAGIKDARTLVLLFAYSFAVWAVIAATFGLGLLALDVRIPLPAASVSLMVIVAAFVSLPQAPGFVGTWQAGCVAALALYGVSQEVAIGYSLVTHVVQLVVVIAVGVACLAVDNVRLGELATLARSEAKHDA